MGITINGSSAAGNIDLGTNGTITDLAVGGLPDGTVDADSMASIPATKLTGTIADARFPATLPAVSGANLTGISSPLSFRNKIINGAIQINQRGDKTGNSAEGYFGPDRFQWKQSGGGTWTIQQDSGPADKGFANSLLYHCTSSGTMTGSNHAYFRHKVEAQDLTDWKWGTAQAEDVTLSFWVKSTETGTGTITCFHYDHDTSDANTAYTYTISAANTWEKKTISLVKSTDNAFDDNNGTGLAIYWNLDGGPDLKSGTANTSSWGSWSGDKWMVGQTFGIATAGRKFWITGIQLEAGSTATDFEHRTYADELQRCLRYYYRHAGETENSGYDAGICNCSYYSNSVAYGVIQLPVKMRVQPSLDQGNSESNAFRIWRNGGSENFQTFAISTASWNWLVRVGNSGVSGTAGQSGYMETEHSSAYLAFDAEL